MYDNCGLGRNLSQDRSGAVAAFVLLARSAPAGIVAAELAPRAHRLGAGAVAIAGGCGHRRGPDGCGRGGPGDVGPALLHALRLRSLVAKDRDTEDRVGHVVADGGLE